MIKADIKFYKEVFNGDLDITERTFNRNLRRAINYINTFTFNRVDKLDEATADVAIIEAVKSCECDIVEYLVDVEEAGNKISESVDGSSVTYASRLVASSTVNSIVRAYLGKFNLTCAWI